MKKLSSFERQKFYQLKLSIIKEDLNHQFETKHTKSEQ